MVRNGLLITNEGPDGSGKATQTKLLCSELQRKGFTVVRYDFPTYGRDPVAATIRMMLGEMSQEWNRRSWQSKALLFASNRANYRDALLDQLAEHGTIVVCNRYVPSNQAHMAAYLEDLDPWDFRFSWIDKLEYELLDLPRPDLVLFHTMGTHTSQSLLERRGVKDAHEADVAYQERVELAYRKLARNDSSWIHVPADVGGGVEPPKRVHERVWTALSTHEIWRSFVRDQAANLR